MTSRARTARGRIAFTALFDRFPDRLLATHREQLSWRHGDGLVLRGLADLPVHDPRQITQQTKEFQP
jgi:hypothetical protein